MSEIKVSGLSHVYSADTPFEKIAIDNVNVEIPHGQLVGLIGHTGSGKSTFIQHLNGLLVPSSGTVLVDSVNINGDKAAARDVRFKVGLVFQYPEYQLFEETVYADIAFGPKNMKLSESEIDERVREAAALVGVGEELFERSPLELSGGQKRRVAIAGVIAMAPRACSSSMSRRPDLTLPAVREYLKRSATTEKRPARPLSSSATAWMTLHA